MILVVTVGQVQKFKASPPLSMYIYTHGYCWETMAY